ncbi:tape measure protein [Paracoccus sp. (in: a-proteobacteria)]|uniref:tape measure protein n=1 Tax=Paracoccus sp. TaxID=267 RepID=UPI00258822BA|nr:tape measure protein [Paracoccus sp. (in: a-proteobacteria)]
MATDLEKLVVQLSADIKGYEREMRKAVGVTNRQARDIEKRFLAMQRNLDGIGSRAAKSLIAPFTGIAAALGGRELIRMTGQWTDLTSRVNLAAGSMEKGNEVMRRVSEMARRTYSDLSQTAEGYLAFSTTLTELGVSTDRQLDFVESLNNALVVSGAKGQTAERVMGALSKAMALGSLQGDNLNTVIDSGGRVAQALADSMGVTTMELRKLGSEGKIGRRELLGISKEMEKLRREAGEMPTTIQDGFMLLNNALLEYVGRGDDAVGMSGRIAEALTVIADNFDTVADSGLKLAAVLAAGMLGRSIGGMITKLGAATGVLIKFGAALRAATSMASVGTAIGGLSAAAGPLGMVIGGLLAGGVLLYSDRAREAEQRSKDLRDELQRLGLYAPDAAVALEEVADAADGIGTEDQLARIERFRKGLEDIKGTGGLWSWISGGDGELDGLIQQVDRFYHAFDQADLPLVRQLRDLAKAYQDKEISAESFARSVAAADLEGAGRAAREYAAALREIAERSKALTTGLLFDGVAVEIDSATESANGLVEELRRLSDNAGLGSVVVDEVNQIIQEMYAGEKSAEAAGDAIEDLGEVYPQFSMLFGRIAKAIGALGELRAAAIRTASTIAATVAMRPGSGGDDTSLEKQGAAAQAFLDEQRRLNALSREQRDIEERTARIMKDAATSQAAITEEQARQLAIEQAAADARRAEEGRSARSGGGGRKSGGGKGKKGTTGTDIFEDAGRDLENLERQIELVGKSTQETAKLRAQWELLDAAKKAGLPIDDKLRQNIMEHAEHVGYLTDQLEKAEIAQQQFDQAIDGVADAFAGALMAGESLREGMAQVLKQIAADIINSGIRNALIGQFGGGGGGILGGLWQSMMGGGDRLTGALRLAGLPARANGGPVQAGQMYMTGEKGPEPFVPAVNGRILSVAQAQAALRGRAGGRSGGINATFAPNISIAPGVTQAELAMTMAAAQREYEQKFLPMLQKHMPSYNERYT